MANIPGLSRDLIIHPGETLKEALFERKMTQKELAARTGRTEIHVSRVVKGHSITPDFAKKLEYALDIPAYFWNNLQKNYDQEIADFEDRHSISEEEQQIYSKIKHVLGELIRLEGLKPEENETFGVIQARKVLKLANLELMTEPQLSIAYRTASVGKIDEHINFVWNKLCDAYLEKEEIRPFLGAQELVSRIPEIKSLMLEEDISDSVHSLKTLFTDLGIRFVVVRHYKGAPHHGRVSRNPAGGVDICVTIRQARADIFWFSLFHELAHIINGDLEKKAYSEQNEQEANMLAATLLIPDDDYEKFVKKDRFDLSSIEDFANQVGVPDFIVIGRLQKDKKLGWNQYSSKMRYLKWTNK